MVTLCDRRDCGVRVEVLTARGVPTRNEVNEANQPGGQRHERKRCRFAANKVPWRGCTVSEVRIIPVPYSDVAVTAPEAAYPIFRVCSVYLHTGGSLHLR